MEVIQLYGSTRRLRLALNLGSSNMILDEYDTAWMLPNDDFEKFRILYGRYTTN